FVWSTIPPRTLPSFAEVRTAWCPSDVRVLDRHGEVIYETRTDPVTRRLAWASLPEISPSFVAAVVASEDRRFLEHHGVDWKAVLSAVRQRIEGSGPRGASTITMQLAALLDRSLSRGHDGRSLDEKWEQMREAWALERAWTKEEILEAYLNVVTLRGEVEGVRAAANAIFAKAPHGLSLEDS